MQASCGCVHILIQSSFRTSFVRANASKVDQSPFKVMPARYKAVHMPGASVLESLSW